MPAVRLPSQRSMGPEPEPFRFGGGDRGLFGVVSDALPAPARRREPVPHKGSRALARFIGPRRCAGSNLPPSARAFRYLRSLSDLWTPFGRLPMVFAERICPPMLPEKG